MDDRRRTCAHCGATGPARAEWCALCLRPFGRPAASPSTAATEALAPPPARLHAPPDRRGPRSRRALATLAILAVFFAGAAARAFGEVRRANTIPLEARADPRGFRFAGLDPASGEPVRFDPCSDVHYVVNRFAAPSGGVEDVHVAVRKVSEATGLRFVFDGFTEETPRPERELVQSERYGERWAPVLFAWNAGDPAAPSGHVAGQARPEYRMNDEDRLVYVSGTVVLNAEQPLLSGFGGRTWGKVILHEVGHIVGLHHTNDPYQVMNPSVEATPASWGDGDLAGLRALGAEAGCLDQPPLPRL